MPKASSSSLPPPKSSTSASSSTTSKKVVQFRPPPMINPFSSGVNDEDDDEEEEEIQRMNSKTSLSTSSAMSFLSSMPAPKNSATLGAMPSALGYGRRCIIESEDRDSTESVTGSDKVVSSNVGFVNDQSDEMNYDNSSWSLGSTNTTNHSAIESFHGENVAAAVVSSVMENDGGVNSNLGSSEVKSDELNYDYSGRISGSESYYNHHNGGQFFSVGPEAVDYLYGNEDHSDYPNYAAGYGYYSKNPQDENNCADTSIMTAFPEASGGVENALNVYGKRGRRDAPQDIVEVKQDELMKNRPREDQTKMTGIAFGLAYQKAAQQGTDLSTWDLFLHTHRRADGTFVDERSRLVHQSMETYMDEHLTPLDDGTIPEQPSSEEVDNMFHHVVGGRKKARMYGCGSMASSMYPQEMASRPRGGRSGTSWSQESVRLREELEQQNRLIEFLRMDLQAEQKASEEVRQQNRVMMVGWLLWRSRYVV